MKQGKFIVFEGLDGGSKTTQLERLGARLTEKLGTNAVYCTREPGDSAPGILCQQFSQKKLALAPETVAPLYAADRVEHIAKDLLCLDWKPAKRCCAIGTIFPTSPTRPLPLI